MTYLLFQMALYMLATLLLGFILGWYIWGNLFEDGNVLGKLGFASGGAAGSGGATDQSPKIQALERRNSQLEEELARLNSHRAGLENDLDTCKSERKSLEQQVTALKGKGTTTARSATAATRTATAAPTSAPRFVSEAPKAAARTTSRVASKPQGIKGPRNGRADDLTEIKGIGPKLEKMLNGMGFYHFDQIANWGNSDLAWVDDNLEGFKGRASRDEWVKQAKKLT